MLDITDEIRQLIASEWEFDFEALPGNNDGHNVYRFMTINRKDANVNYAIDYRVKVTAGGLSHAKMIGAKNMLYKKIIQHHAKQ